MRLDFSSESLSWKCHIPAISSFAQIDKNCLGSGNPKLPPHQALIQSSQSKRSFAPYSDQRNPLGYENGPGCSPDAHSATGPTSRILRRLPETSTWTDRGESFIPTGFVLHHYWIQLIRAPSLWSQDLFSPVTSKIVQIIVDTLKEAKKQQKLPNRIILAGGFSESLFLQVAIPRQFQCSCLQDTNAS